MHRPRVESPRKKHKDIDTDGHRGCQIRKCGHPASEASSPVTAEGNIGRALPGPDLGPQAQIWPDPSGPRPSPTAARAAPCGQHRRQQPPYRQAEQELRLPEPTQQRPPTVKPRPAPMSPTDAREEDGQRHDEGLRRSAARDLGLRRRRDTSLPHFSPNNCRAFMNDLSS